MKRLQGGSAATNRIAEYNNAGGGGSNGPALHMFHDKSLQVEFAKDGHKGIIMPSFAVDLHPDDKAYMTSVAPYRIVGSKDDERETECFTPWYNQLKAYTFYGKSKCHFFSCVEYIDDDGNHPWRWDPIMDMRNEVYKMSDKLENNPLGHLIKPKGKNDITWLPRAADVMLMNVLCKPTYDKAKDKSERVRIMLLKQMAGAKLLDDLDCNSLRSAKTLVDENWPDYKLGDVTNPLRPLQFTGAKMVGDTGIEYTGIVFSDEKNKLGSDVVVREKLTKAQLSERYDLMDVENLIYIPTYEEMVDFLVQLHDIPYDLLESACADKYDGTFPQRSAVKKTVSAPERPTAGRSSGLAGKRYDRYDEEDEDDNIPGIEDDDPRQPIDDDPPSFDDDDEPEEQAQSAAQDGDDPGSASDDFVMKSLMDESINPDGLSAEDWYDWAASVGFRSLHTGQLRLFAELKKTRKK